MTVRVDKEVLAATVVALDDLAGTLPTLFSRASSLDARIDMAGLNGAEEWASETSKDLRGRIGVLEQMAQAHPSFGGVRMTGPQALEIAGQSMHVEDAAIALRATGTQAGAWENDDPANLSEWFEQLQAEAVKRLAGMSDTEQAQALVDGYNDIQNLITASNATVVTTTQILLKGGPALARWLGEHRVNAALTSLANSGKPGLANWLSGALNVADNNYLRAKTTFTYPGAFVPNVTQKMLLRAAPVIEGFDDWVARLSAKTKPFTVMVNGEARPQPTLLAKLLQSQQGVKATTWVSDILRTTSSGQLAQKLAGWGNVAFGKPWTNPATGATFGRGAGNLWTMANQSGLRTMASTAGVLRVAGVAGSAFATVDSAVGLWNNREENAELWAEGGTQGKAHVVGEYAETAFNASMTAALIAPNPTTLGLVAVTGLVWAGAEVVEHWDDITKAADEAVDWVGDRADDAADWAGDRIDDIKESKINPANWF
ncbi:hypothetical protein [Cellulomonas rhizosphaerae]|uniref:Uncharacterized protein n=1 Tax=Cellulomonas rhizosphaerae TaxID=2293719 RepID=A0A413RPW6_9CELL|nr:hypothetical protein [Cellulomonas rhizosphaerae]RHA43948.1 hypothetical protein D1825_03770 [Cellulomonas rhizosphaerae]